MNELFFELIRISIGNQSTASHAPSAQEWLDLYAIAKKQSLIGVCFAGIQNVLHQENIPEPLYFQWMAVAVKIQQKNEQISCRCAELHSKLSDDGYKSCVLKGQAVASLYGLLAEFRQPGDIDMWMVADPEKVIEWARATGSMYYYDYHHADLSLFEDPSTGSGQGTEIELHYRPSLSRNLVRNARLQRWFQEEGAKHILFKEDLGFAVPDYIFNVVLTMNHNFWHLLYEGVGMRQIMDLYFVLMSCPDQEAKGEALRLLKHLKLERFTSASMWIMKEVFGLEDEYLLCDPDESAGRFLLDEIMQAGNFGKHDERLKDGRYKSSRISLMWAWMRHTSRLFKYYPADVLWTPIGILRISLWRRWHYRNESELKNI